VSSTRQSSDHNEFRNIHTERQKRGGGGGRDRKRERECVCVCVRERERFCLKVGNKIKS